jgi:hypothetical protein
MKYLIVSCTLYDLGGVAMIQGAMNGIRKFDGDAKFMSLHHRVHDAKHQDCGSFIFPESVDKAFKWADGVIDIGGVCDAKPRSRYYRFKKARIKHKKPLVWMAQNFNRVSKPLLQGTKIFSRGQSTSDFLFDKGFESKIVPDLSFLIEPDKVYGSYRYGMTTHGKRKKFDAMFSMFNPSKDVQVLWKKSKNGRVFEPLLGGIVETGTVEHNFGVIANCEKVHTARYQAACAAILSGVPYELYTTDDLIYNKKYDDLNRFSKWDVDTLKDTVLESCKETIEWISKKC